MIYIDILGVHRYIYGLAARVEAPMGKLKQVHTYN